MPDFVYDLNEDGSIKAVYKDGVKLETATRLEMPVAIVQTYFRSAIRALARMTESADDGEDNRQYGLQAFLMSLVGTEAFFNVFFHQVGREKGLANVIDFANKDRVPIEHKLSHLPRQAFGTPLPAQKRLNAKMRELYDLRSKIVHPRWQPSSFVMPGLAIGDLVENYQTLFEDREFCRDALRWCLLVIARVGLHAQVGRGDQFVEHWTTIADTNATLSDALGVPREGA
ncbi:hypothetical protein [Sphingomonas nostoxanthinifaciens]|uniref:hypothetical protein n=1 Tax=Sphingomonas nostoxanthinifaciens TaxID=2872652 RepID=UPI001CC1EA00|nr:hypothetical protein [Sphingomonas nostoxanthinifaciens]UAK23844.1 hypothetical protein K8P63_15925 [Sphingomonas nostoxanthinifaciens]